MAARREVLYPRLSRDVPDGDSLVDLGLLGWPRSSGRARSSTAGAEPSFHPLVTKLATEVWEHLDEEEGDVLPAVVDAIGEWTRRTSSATRSPGPAPGCGNGRPPGWTSAS